MSSPLRAAWFLALGVRGLCAAAGAQTNDDINAGIQYNFSTPGARSLAMGGAFLAVADDATAAYTNPAGLTNLTVGGPEVSLELRQWRYTNSFTDHGHTGGRPTGIGLDTFDGLVAGEAESEASGVSFVSLGYVLPGGWTLALYRHEVARFKAEIESQGAFVELPGGLFRILPTRSRLDLEVVNYGVSGAYEVGDGVSVGLGVSYYRGRLDSLSERFFRGEADAPGNRLPGGFYGLADFLGDNVNDVRTQHVDDDDFAFNLGVLWRIDRHWSAGGAYRQGPDFDLAARYVYGPRGPAPGQPASPNLCSPSRTTDCVGGQGVLHVPDVYGLGVAWGTEDAGTKLTLDYNRVRYSQLTADLINVLARERIDFDRAEYRVDDAGEIHLGFENVLAADARLVATLRLGAWLDPGHALEYVGPDPVLRARFQPAYDEVHGTAGVGLVIKEGLQVDVAVDLSKRAKTAALSFVKFF